MKADGEAGIGRQIVIKDVNGDKLPDILTGGMVGAHVLLHRTKTVTEAEWQAAQPQPLTPNERAALIAKEAPPADTTERVPGALEGEALAASIKASAGTVKPQNMKNFSGSRWSGDAQFLWTGGKMGDQIEITLNAPEAAAYTLETVLTRAPDFAIVQLALDGKDLGTPVDLYDAKVTTTGVLKQPLGQVTAGPHQLVIRISGTNPKAKPNRYVGLDYMRLVKQN